MIRQKITVTLETDDGYASHVLTVDARDMRRWEAWRGESAIAGGLTASRLTEWAYLAGVRGNLWNGTYEDWEPSCVEVRAERAERVDPTRTARSGEPSSASASAPASPRKPGKKQGNKPS